MKAIHIAALMALCTGLVLSACDKSDSATDSNSNEGKTKDTAEPIGVGYNKSTYGIPWNDSLTFGTITDGRDKQVYRTVEFGTKTWMVENLNYGGAGVCPGKAGTTIAGTADSCSKYGRLYTWAEVMQGSSSSSSSPSGVKGICPTGWHVPSDSDWDDLPDTDGNKLKATAGWLTKTGTDLHGFRALPAGKRSFEGPFNDVGLIGYWWTSTESEESYAVIRQINDNHASFYLNRNYKGDAYSLRCSQD